MSRVRVDFSIPLRSNLERLGIEVVKEGAENTHRTWMLNGTNIGSFDVHEGWVILRHYDLCRNWHFAIRSGLGELYCGYDWPNETWEEYLERIGELEWQR